MSDDRCEAVHGPTGERCLRGQHTGRHVARGPVDWTGSGEGGTTRGRKTREESSIEAKPWLVYRPGKGYFWGEAHPKSGEPAHFGCDGRRE